jgi:uncharacterized membrane protein
MFELLFKYPVTAFQKGDLLLLSRWPAWLLGVLVVIAAVALAYPIWRRRESVPVRVKPVAIWLLQTTMVAIFLVLLWQPALSVATLRPQQNVVALVVDDSRSMALNDGSEARIDQVKRALNPSILKSLEGRFQVRLYRAATSAERVASLDALKAEAQATRLGDSMRAIASEAASLPVGAVVLLSDGADNSGGIDLATISEIRKQRIPVHTVGFGPERPARDIEVTAAELPQRVLAGSRLSAEITLRQYGYDGQRVRLSLKDGGKVLAARDIVLKKDGVDQVEMVPFTAGPAGVKTIQVTLEPLSGEENKQNNSVTRLVAVDDAKPRILYIEGEPKWEYKFIRRAIEQDDTLQLVSMVRTTQNKLYRQGISNGEELAKGFPATVDELFGFRGVIIGGVEANYFTPTQQELLRQFVDRRGGGLLFLGGRGGLSDGGWMTASIADLLPSTLPNRKDAFRREQATVELTTAGRDSLVCRIDDDPQRNIDRWKKLPYLANYQDPGTPKPGAAVLADMLVGRQRMPFLLTQNYGRGRTALLATSGTWRWQMSQPVEDMSHEMFWQQMLRWLVAGTTGPVLSTLPKSVLSDDQRVPLRAEVRDKNYIPVSDASVEANIMGPNGLSEKIELQPDPTTVGLYTADWGAVPQGSYVVETVARRGDEEAGRDIVTFRREDGVAENFSTHQNRELLEKLAQQTGGKYWRPTEVNKLAEEISYSESGISIRETRDLWNAPFFFILALLLRGSEWLLRRKWGVV